MTTKLILEFEPNQHGTSEELAQNLRRAFEVWAWVNRVDVSLFTVQIRGHTFIENGKLRRRLVVEGERRQ